MPSLTTNGINVPSAFPASSYDNVQQSILAEHSGTLAFKKFSGGWNALAFRYAEALECADQFEQSFVAHGAAPPPPERYNQERILFDFYSSALSALEACGYAIFALASMKDGANFPLVTPADERKITPTYLRDKLSANFANDQLTLAWDSLLNDPRYKDLHQTRNVLTHRIAVSRHHHVGGAQHGAAVWELTNAAMTKNMLKPSAADLTDLLGQIVPAAEQFTIS